MPLSNAGRDRLNRPTPSGIPADHDSPRAAAEASWWPLVAASGATVLYIGVGLVAISRHGPDLVDPLAGVGVGVAGMAVVGVGLAGWTYQAFMVRYWDRLVGEMAAYRWGLVLFLATEVATFGTVFAYYAFVRLGPWPPGPLPPLLTGSVAINTLVLVVSSVTLHVAHAALRADRRRAFVGLLAATLALGIGFLLGQLLEYTDFVHREGFTLSSGVFGSAFYALTGLHGLHVTLGVVLLSVLLGRSLVGHYGPDRHASMTTVSYYWHFVTAVWLGLVLTIYLGAAIPR